jgi:hypothetical protein
MQNPVGNHEFLKEFGIGDFPPPTGKDTERAQWENDLLRQRKFKDVEVLPFDNPVIHYNVIVEEMKRPEFWQNLDEEVIAQFSIHAIKHYLDMSPQQVQMAGVTPTQEIQIIAMGDKLQGIMNPVQVQQLKARAQQLMMMQQASMMPPQGVPTGQNPEANLPPASATTGASGNETLQPIPPEVALNTQGGRL